MVDGYGVKGKFTSNTGASAAKKNKEKKYKDASFRADEEKSLTKSIGTASPKMRADGTPKDDSGPTAKQKEEFREQEETYQTKSPGTVGDKYYKNPEGTGTGQGGSGIPVDKTETQQTPTVTSAIYLQDFSSDNYKDIVQTNESIIEPIEESLLYSKTNSPLETFTPASRRQYPRSQESLLAGSLGPVKLKLKLNLLDQSKTFIQAIEGKVTF